MDFSVKVRNISIQHNRINSISILSIVYRLVVAATACLSGLSQSGADYGRGSEDGRGGAAGRGCDFEGTTLRGLTTTFVGLIL